MSITPDHIARVRMLTLGLTGVICAVYAGLALALNRPDPMPWWLPGGFGIASSVLIFMASFAAGRAAARAATDELYFDVSRRAASKSYWISLGLFVLAAVAENRFDVQPDAAMAALGTSMGACYLLLFVWHDVRLG